MIGDQKKRKMNQQMMTGKEKMRTDGINSLGTLYSLQTNFQKNLKDNENIPIDSVKDFQYHISAMLEELGELLQSDKRWKSHRNSRFDNTEKLEELADVFITCLNLSIFSGYSSNDLYEAIVKKIIKNERRLEHADNC